MVNNMANSIVKKMKGLFTMSKNKKKKADVADTADTADTGTGFDILDDSQAPAAAADPNGGASDSLGAPKKEPIVEPPVESESIPEKTEEIEAETEVKKEKTHERVARIAAEMNTKGYGL